MSKSEKTLVRKIGYARVSTADQNPDLQIQALKDYGVPEELIFVDRASGGSMKRPAFLQALRFAQHPGTEFVVWKLDRLGRTLEGILEVLNLLDQRGISFFSLTERVDVTTPMGKAMLQMMGVVAELERNLIVERTKAGIERAKARGEKPGRPVCAAILLFAWGGGPAFARHNTLLNYQCWEGNSGTLAGGACLPHPTTHFDQNGRVAMYVRCRVVKGGQDEYTGNCCDHLRPSDSHQLKVCEGITNPESGLGLILQIQRLSLPTRWVCEAIDCQVIGRKIGVPWL